MTLVYRQLPVIEAVKESFRLASAETSRHAAPIMALVAAYIGLTAIAIVLPYSALLVAGVAGVITAGFAVGTHRLILQAERPGGLRFFRFDKSALKYMALFIAIPIAQYLIVFIGGMLLRPLGAAGLIIGFFGALFLALRLFLRTPLMFPAIAIGDDARLRDCWDQMYGNAIGFLVGAILISAPLGILNLALNYPAVSIGVWPTIPVEAVAATLTVFVNAIYFSLSYNHLVRHAEKAKPAELEPITAQ